MNDMINSIIIRIATPTDAPAMAEVYMRSWEAAYKGFIPADYISEKRGKSVPDMKRLLADESLSPYQYVIILDKSIVGILTVAYARDEDAGENCYELWGVYLHPEYFRRGIGSLAMEFAYEKARCLGKTEIILWVFEKNEDSIKFYEKCGFSADGCRKTIICGKPLAAIRMRKKLA